MNTKFEAEPIRRQSQKVCFIPFIASERATQCEAQVAIGLHKFQGILRALLKGASVILLELMPDARSHKDLLGH